MGLKATEWRIIDLLTTVFELIIDVLVHWCEKFNLTGDYVEKMINCKEIFAKTFDFMRRWGIKI